MLLVQGQAPYQFNPPYGPYIAPWWPQIIGASLWMGWLSCWQAAKLWLAIELIGFGLVIWLLNDRKKPTPVQLGLILLVAFLFPPIYTHFHLGQFSLLFLTMMIMAVFLPLDDFPPSKLPWWLPLLLVLGASKPQLSILIYPGLLAVTWKRQGWKGLTRLAATSFGWLLVCLIPIFAFYPDWASGFVATTRYNLDIKWELPTPFVQLTYNLGTTGLLIWLLLYFSILVLTLWIWLRRGPREGMIWSMALTPVVTAYASSWDFTLLLPAFIWLLLKLCSNWSRAALVLGMILVDAAQVVIRLGKDAIPDGSQWWIPLAMLAVFTVAMLIERWKVPLITVHPVSGEYNKL